MSPLADAAVNAAIAALAALHAQALSAPSAAGVPAATGDVLTIALSDAAIRTAVASLAVAHGFDTADFWTALDRAPNLTATHKQALHSTIALARITAGYVQFMRYLASTYADARALVKLDVPAIVKLLGTTYQGQPIGVPKGTPGATPAAQAERYATAVHAAILRAFPTPSFAARLATDGLPAKKAIQADLQTFFNTKS